MPCRLILDAMGGDHGPQAILEGASLALPELSQLPGELVIVGDEAVIRPLLGARRNKPLAYALDQASKSHNSFRISLVHAPQNIDMEDSIRAIRNKPGATINVGCQLAAESYRKKKKLLTQAGKTGSEVSPDTSAFISAGHSGAVMASALLHMGRLSKVERPAIAVKLPTLSPDGCVLIDVGANVDCKPEHLRDFAIMGAIFSRAELRKSTPPRIALLSNGEERKGK